MSTGVDKVKERIRAEVSLESLIGEHVSLQRRGGQPTACCPFHEERSPSFYVYDDHYHCFGCGAHGDAISYVQHQQGLGFFDALRWLAQRYNISAAELEQNSGQYRAWQEKARLGEVLLKAQDFFVNALHHSRAGADGLSYLQGRGFTLEQIKEFGFGFAPDANDSLSVYLRKQGYSLELLEQASLIHRAGQRAYDFFRFRVTLPILDIQGRVVAFGGRALDGQIQKYKNSRYNKAKILFGMDRARTEIKSKGRAIVVEGYMDALQMMAKGFSETVACQGTALTKDHMKTLQSATKLVFLLFDGDRAGREAMIKLLNVTLDFPELRFRVAQLPDGEDPDSFLRQYGADKLEELLESSAGIFSYVITNRFGALEKDQMPAVLKRDFIPWLAKIDDDPLKRNFLVSQICGISGLHEKSIYETLDSYNRNNAAKPVAASKEGSPAAEAAAEKPSFEVKPLTLLDKEWVGHIFHSNWKEGLPWGELASYLKKEMEWDELWLNFATFMLEQLEQRNNPSDLNPNIWAGYSEYVVNLLTEITAQKGAFIDLDRKNAFERLKILHKSEKIRETISALGERIARQMREEEDWQSLAKEMMSYHSELKNLGSGLQSLD